MSQGMDVKILPLFWKGERLWADHPGLHVAYPPRRSPRRRAEERLILHLELAGNAPLNTKAKTQLLEKLADVYYQSEGSTTSALRNVGEVLNKYLLDRNLRGASRGVRAVGILTQIVLRDTRLVVAQSGSTHAFLIQSGELDELYDIELSGPGLGVGRMPKIRYHQWEIQPGSLVLTTSEVPMNWNENTLRNLSRMEMDSALKRLLHRTDQNLDAVLVSIREGNGKIRVLRPMLDDAQLKGAGEEGAPGREPEPGEPGGPAGIKENLSSVPPLPSSPSSSGADDEGLEADRDDSQPAQTVRPGTPPWEEDPDPEPDQQVPPESSVKASRSQDLTREQVGTPVKNPAKQSSLTEIRELPIWGILGSLLSSLRNGVVEILRNLTAFLGRMMPNEDVLNLPPWVLGLIAVMVPLVMVTFGSVFYIKRGRDRLYTDAYQQAQFYLQEAAMAAEEEEHYRSLSSALEYLELARGYQETEEIEDLYQSTRKEVDNLDRITRLDYQPLFSRGLGSDVEIAELVVTSWNDLYILNEVDGSVIWAQSNADGYQIKKNFTCGPVSGHKEIGPLVDIVAYSASQNDKAAVLGIDRSHVMIICYTEDGEPPVLFEDTSYTLERGPVRAITLSTNPPENLYILDNEKRAIWIEYQSENYHEGSEYFGAVDSPPMADAVDLATNGSEMYLLHADGYLTRCVKETPTSNPQCQTPFEFSDPRAGRESGPFIAGADFQSLKLKSAPGMALYMLDSSDLALYRFSTQLELQKQFRPGEGMMEGEAGAFAVTMSDRVFLGVGNQVYTAQLIP